MKKFISIFIILFVMIIPFSYAHSGRTDANGGHYDWSTGEYHYHNDGSISGTEILLDDSKYIEGLEEENKRLENQVEYKQQYIDSLVENHEEQIEEYEKDIENEKNVQNTWHFIYITVIIIFIMYLYSIKKEYKKYEILSKIIMKGLGTFDIDKAIADTSKFYTDQGIDIKEDN